MTAPRVWFVRREAIEDVLDRKHLTHREMAAILGISRPYWSQIINGHRHATARLRGQVTRHPFFAKMKAEQLWRIEERPRSAHPLKPAPDGAGARAA